MAFGRVASEDLSGLLLATRVMISVGHSWGDDAAANVDTFLFPQKVGQDLPWRIFSQGGAVHYILIASQWTNPWGAISGFKIIDP